MLRLVPGLLGALIVLTACSRGREAAPRRAVVEAAGPGTIRVVPAERQPPFCLVFAVPEKGPFHQLTMTPANESIPCPAGQPVGGTEYRIPAEEGKVRLLVVFSDRKLDATPIGLQVRELGKSPGFSAMDLRAPGQIVLETLEHTPR